MERIITVSEREELTTKSGKPYIAITDQDGRHYNVFEPSLFMLIKEGEQIKLVGERNGNFINIQNVEPVEETHPDRSRDTNASIERQVLAKIVSELWMAGNLTSDDPEVKGLRRWIRQKLPDELTEQAKSLRALEYQ